MKTIRDLIYLDLGKATSLLSQIEGGLIKEFKEKDETVDTTSGDAKLGIKIIESGFGKTSSDSTAIERTKVLHHELLDTIEEWLFTNGFALDLNGISVEGQDGISPEQFRELISNVSYIRAEGWATIDNFSGLQEFAKNFPDLVQFINKCNRSSIQDNEEYKLVLQTITDEKRELKKITDRNLKTKKEIQIKEKEKILNEMMQEITKVNVPDEWLLKGISDWIEQFNHNQIHFRIKPFSDNHIEVTSNLKREYFIDTDIDHLLFTYGVKPNVKLTLFGLITSIPPKEYDDETPTSGEKEESKGESEKFQSAFRAVFRALREFEKFSGFELYPNIKIYPIAVYRKIESCFNAEENAAPIAC